MIELTAKGTNKVIAYACDKCHIVARTKELAEQCCKPHICACGATRERGWLVCDQCRAKKSEAKEKRQFEKAQKISHRDYDGPVATPCLQGSGSVYWDSADDFRDSFAEWPNGAFPQYVWACTKFGLSLVASEIVNEALERQEHHEDVCENLDIDGLQRLMDNWLKNQTLESWMIDYTRAVLLEGIENGE